MAPPRVGEGDRHGMSEPLPQLLAEIADRLGREAALKLAKKLGGQRVRVPKHPRVSSPLVEAVGMETALALADLYGGELVIVPMAAALSAAARRRAIANDGRSANTVAAAMGCHVNTVYRLRRGARIDPRQIDLFKRD